MLKLVPMEADIAEYSFQSIIWKKTSHVLPFSHCKSADSQFFLLFADKKSLLSRRYTSAFKNQTVQLTLHVIFDRRQKITHNKETAELA